MANASLCENDQTVLDSSWRGTAATVLRRAATATALIAAFANGVNGSDEEFRTPTPIDEYSVLVQISPVKPPLFLSFSYAEDFPTLISAAFEENVGWQFQYQKPPAASSPFIFIPEEDVPLLYAVNDEGEVAPTSYLLPRPQQQVVFPIEDEYTHSISDETEVAPALPPLTLARVSAPFAGEEELPIAAAVAQTPFEEDALPWAQSRSIQLSFSFVGDEELPLAVVVQAPFEEDALPQVQLRVTPLLFSFVAEEELPAAALTVALEDDSSLPLFLPQSQKLTPIFLADEEYARGLVSEDEWLPLLRVIRSQQVIQPLLSEDFVKRAPFEDVWLPIVRLPRIGVAFTVILEEDVPKYTPPTFTIVREFTVLDTTPSVRELVTTASVHEVVTTPSAHELDTTPSIHELDTTSSAKNITPDVLVSEKR